MKLILLPQNCGDPKVLRVLVQRGSCLKPSQKLIYATEVAENYKISLENKNIVKANYYQNEVKLLEGIAEAKEKSGIARKTSNSYKDGIFLSQSLFFNRKIKKNSRI